MDRAAFAGSDALDAEAGRPSECGDMTRKEIVLAMLERAPATTGEIRRALKCANAAQAYSVLTWLEDCGAIMRRRVARDTSSGGPSRTTEWALAIAP